MSDFEDDIDNQLLELAGATEKKKRRRLPSNGSGGAGAGGSGKAAGGSKKRRADRMDSDSDKEVESEEEVDDPYPLEGKFKNEEDKRELMRMTEFQREQILEERSGERQKIQNAKMLADLVRQQQRGGTGAAEDSVARAAKRQHTARGTTKEKAHKLDELKAKRKAKDEKKRSKGNDGSPSQRERSSSPQDMDISDSESEDGQITKYDQEEERLDKLTSGYDSYKNKKASKEEEADVPCNMADLETCRLSRDVIAKHCLKPWFQDYVTGAWVRYLIGQESTGESVYRICQVNNLAPDLVKPYKINDKTINQAIELKHGKSVKTFNMDKVSNGPFLEKEYERLVKTCSLEDVKLPTKQSLERKVTQMQKLVSQIMTESDISAILARKNQLQTKATTLSTLDRSMLIQQRTLAIRRQDFAEVAAIEEKLAADAAKTPEPGRNDSLDLLAKVNERNRKANIDAMRKAEIESAERKRRERKLALEKGVTGSPVDPSARLKITPRTFNAATPTTTRPGTPVVNGKSGLEQAPPAGKTPVAAGSSFEASLIDSIEIDLGDF